MLEAVAAADFGIIFGAIALTILIYGAWYFGTWITQFLTAPFRLIPIVGGDIADYLTARIIQLLNAAHNSIVGWWSWATQPFTNLMDHIASQDRVTGYAGLNTTRYLASAVAYVWGNTINAVPGSTTTTITQVIQADLTRVEADIQTARAEAIAESEGYTASVGNWAWEGFKRDEAAISQTQAVLQQSVAQLSSEIAQTRTLAVNVAGQAASAALSESQRELVQVREQLNSKIDVGVSTAEGVALDVGNTIGAQVGALEQQVHEYEQQTTDFTLTHVIPVVATMEKVGLDCVENLCGGMGGYAKMLNAALPLLEEGAFLLWLSSLLRNPEAGARELQSTVAPFVGVGQSMKEHFFGK